MLNLSCQFINHNINHNKSMLQIVKLVIDAGVQTVVSQ